MTRCQFLIDECVPSALTRGLRRRLPLASVIQVGDVDAPPKGSDDPDLLLYAEQEQRLFVSADRSTMIAYVDRHLADGRTTWGVLLMGPHSSLGVTLDELCLVFEATEAEEWKNIVRYLPMF
jgi:hypothetical protein